ncbi:TonB-dependent receptor [Methylobacillus gramineus]|uniref:TonB-dependent receptor n=1 Tax=Methylobacillus gramineus TaxID=755169 RepID=UPI001CFFD1EF|nr:TonB-dependent receptor [Methylobacillus gramineus]MCB5186277.1 TonB-dependent receptor [Methylobacillus gramineus]
MKYRYKLLTLCVMAAVNVMPSLNNPAYADHVTTKDTDGDSTVTVGGIVITGNRSSALPARSILSSVDVIGKEAIEHQAVQNSWQLLSRAPGVMLTEYRMGTTTGKFSFRGFNGEGEVNAVKLLIDGIPSNSNDGNMPYLDMVMPLDIEAIEVVRGTNDPRYGLHNIAGNANVVTKIGGNYATARASYGSFNTRELQTALGIEKDGFSQNYFAAVQEYHGYRDHSDSRKASIAGKWFYDSADGRFRTGLIARHYEQDAQEAGYLTYAQSRAHPRQSMPHNNTDGGERELNQLSLHFDWNVNDTLFWSNKAYLNTMNDQRWVRFSIRSPSQQERLGEENHTGVISSLTWRPEVENLGLHSLAIETGFSAEWQNNNRSRYNTIARQRQSTSFDQHFEFDIYGGYIQAVIRPTSTLKIVPAYRIDRVYGNFKDLTSATQADIQDYGVIRQPKIGAVYTPSEHYSLYGNWGRSFQVGVAAATYKVNPLLSNLKPSINDGWEVGIKFQPTNWMDGRIAVWEQEASNEVRRILGSITNNDSENIGKTLRRGIDFQANLRPTSKLDLWANLSIQRSEIVKPGNTELSNKDNEIDHVPRQLYGLGADYRVLPTLKLSAWANGQGNYYLERANTQGKFGGYFLMNLGAVWQAQKNISLEVQVRNLTDRYYEYVYWDAQTLHSPGEGRGIYGSVRVDL